MKINDELTKKIAKLAAEIMYSAEKEGEVRSQGEADFVNQHVDNIEVVDNRDEKLGKVEEPKEKEEKKKVVKEEKIEEGTVEQNFLKKFAKDNNLGKYDLNWLPKNKIPELMKLADDEKNHIEVIKFADGYGDPFEIIKQKKLEIFAHEPEWQRFSYWIVYKKGNKKIKKESHCEDDMEEGMMSDEEMEEAAGKLNSYVVFKDSAKKDHKIYGEFIGNDENNTAVISISGKGYTLPKQDVHHSASGMNESVKLNEATEKISSDIWISELGNVLARAETKNLAMAFEAWANSYYKTPVWQSLVNNPLLKNLFDTMAESLDIFIGTSNEERDAKMEESMPSRSYRDLPDEKLKALAQERGMPGMQAKRVLADREKAAKDGKSTYGHDLDRIAKIAKDNSERNGMLVNGMTESSKYVINIEGKIYSEKGKAVEFDDKEKAEKAVAKIKGHSSMTGKEVKVDTLNEESETEIAAIEKEYLAAKDKKAVLKKYDITSGISRLRPGEIKLGIRNELNGRTSFAALDTDGKLIIISGTEKAPKIRYVK
jgi:hypothetical protein